MTPTALFINPSGNEVLLTRETLHQAEVRGEHYSRQQIKYRGTGPEKDICILLNMNGIGDDIHIMPAISALRAQGYNITVAGRPFSKLCFESLGCTFIDEADAGQLDKENFGMTYSLKAWCSEHYWDTDGKPEIDHFEQAAKLLEVRLPASFSWINTFSPHGIYPIKVILALTSSAKEKSYPLGEELYLLFKSEHPLTLVLGGKYGLYAPDFERLINYVMSADLVVSVDTSILAIALALGKPAIALMGPTDEKVIVWQYARYREMKSVQVMRMNNGLASIAPQTIFDLSNSILHSLSNNQNENHN